MGVRETGSCLGSLNECFLSGHNHLSPMRIMLFPELHVELEKSWKKPYSACVYPFQHSNYVYVEGLHEQGYVRTSPVEETLSLTGQGIFSEGSSLAI